MGDISKELGRRWSEVTESVKSKYEALAAKDRSRYDVEKRAYQQKLKDEAKGGAGSSGAGAASVGPAFAGPPDNFGADEDEEEDFEDEDEAESD